LSAFGTALFSWLPPAFAATVEISRPSAVDTKQLRGPSSSCGTTASRRC
jgi:hypothetical protein